MLNLFNHINESNKRVTEGATEKSFIANLSKRLLELEFKSYHPIKSKVLKYVVKQILPSL